jgi:hypothetical protein
MQPGTTSLDCWFSTAYQNFSKFSNKKKAALTTLVIHNLYQWLVMVAQEAIITSNGHSCSAVPISPVTNPYQVIP